MPDHSESFAFNKAQWDERVPIHTASEFYDVAGFLKSPHRLRPFEVEEVGDVHSKALVHLQCHFGQDTLSWATRGAKVTGLDFSEPAVEAAREIATRLGYKAEFVASNVYDAVEALGNRTFDIVYTGLGALNWLPDIEGWAKVIAALVKPGGFLYLSEFHPMHQTLSDDDLAVTYDYFHSEPMVWDEPGTYAELGAATTHNVSHEWTHGLGVVVSNLIAQGLRIEFLHEFDYTLYPRWPFLEKTPEGTYHMPAGKPRIPLMYSLKATKPA
ncbi:MAG: class I SAM-dependent methyltransferase [Dehalococcoidia bacterium]|nr:class I SAM-dependent methyltransferase [Dehalococcoidia bacterium]